MRRSSRDFEFISSSPPDDRTFLLKKLDKPQELLDSSPDIESDNIIKHYQRQPKQLEKLCLANFVACYNCVKDERADWSGSGSSVTRLYDFLPETSFDDNPDDDPISINVTECQCEPR